MAGRPKKDEQYLEEHLETLTKLGTKSRQVMPQEYNTFGPWTPLKLIVLKNYVDVYTKILHRERLGSIGHGFKSKVFIDVFCGSGLNKIDYAPNRRAKDAQLHAWFPGSTLIASEYASHDSKFDEIISIDKDKRKLDALVSRMRALYASQPFLPLCGRAEDKLQEVGTKITQEKAHYLALVDYEDIKSLRLDILESLLKERGDVFVTILASGMLRCFGKSLESDNSRATLRRFLTGDVFDALESKALDGRLDISYLASEIASKFRQHKEIVEWIPIRKGSNGYQYLMFFAVSETSGGNPFVKMINGTKDRMSRISGENVAKILPVLSGVQRRIC